MKNNRIIILLLMLILSGCSKKDEKTEYERVAVIADYVLYDDVASLENASDVILIGTFVGETQQELKMEYSGQFGKEILVDAISFANVRINQVLKGDVKVGDMIRVSQRYGYFEEAKQLVCFSSMTPMVEGDYWLFFLRYDEEGETYWCSGDYSGRYPVPEKLSAEALALLQVEDIATSEEKQEALLKLIQPEDFGVYEASNINLKLYLELLEQYNLKFVNIGN